MKRSKGKLVKTLTLGTQFEHGSDAHHFCKPAGVAVSRTDGSIFVADGYCNSRVVHFSKDGSLIAEWGTQSSFDRERAHPPLGTFFLPHDVSLDEETKRVFVADRENGRVQIMTEDGNALDELAAPDHFSNVYSAHFNRGEWRLNEQKKRYACSQPRSIRCTSSETYNRIFDCRLQRMVYS